MSTPSLPAVLDERSRTLTTRLTVWSVAAKHTRAGGDIDVILSTRQKGRRDVRYLAFRRSEGEWTQLSGAWVGLPTAVREAATRIKKQVFTVVYVTPLLDFAALLGDFTNDEKESA